jgi:bacterioferritin
VHLRSGFLVEPKRGTARKRVEESAMKGDPDVIEVLNEILTAELTAINQYYIHAKMCDNWGFERLAHKNREESISEMKHADELIERILFLDGVPNMQRLDKVRVGESVPEQLKLDLQLEQVAIPRFNKAIALAVDVADNTTRELLEDMLTSEEEHVDWLEAQLELIKQVGEQNYLAQQIHK